MLRLSGGGAFVVEVMPPRSTRGVSGLPHQLMAAVGFRDPTAGLVGTRTYWLT